MKKRNYAYIMCLCMAIAGCDLLDTKIDTMMTQEMMESDWSKLQNIGYAAYTYIGNGFSRIDGNIDAAMSDEAAYTASSSSVRLFNEGTWNQYNNPDDVYESCYKGIRAAEYFLDYSTNYEELLAKNRDIISDGGYSYRQSVEDIEWLRAEAHVLKAWYYFELTKRYGDVPLVTGLGSRDSYNLPRTSVEDIVDYSVSEIDGVLDELQTDWKAKDANRDGRFTKGAALALKSRILLYAASPRDNPGNDIEKWKRAAAAAHEVISLNQYSLDPDYRNLFLESNSIQSSEVIMSYRCGAGNSLEKANYPVSTPGGNSGVTPSHNIVDAYEYTGTPDPANPYANRDPRLESSIVLNNSMWNGRLMEIYEGGTDDPANANASRTGYYLKKFMLENLNLSMDETRMHNWIMFRYAEILLNYAEAMNEAYGPDDDNGYGMTARQAVNMVRTRQSVRMPEIVAADRDEMRERIKHERRIELAFEGHRFWDLLRWKDAEKVLNSPVYGIGISREGNSFVYNKFEVEKRIFDASKMYLYPLPYEEINKSGNVLEQNPNW